MTDGVPLIRASYAKTVIGGIKRRSADEQARVLSHVGSELRQEIRGHGMLDWMPAARFSTLVTRVGEAVGAVAGKDFWRANLLLSLERRLLSPLRLGAIAIYGNSPRSLLKMTPQAWELVSKHGGVCTTTDQAQTGIVLRFEKLPSELCVPGMLLLWSGGSESCIEKMGFEGQAIADDTQLRKGIVEIHVTWVPR